MALAPDTRLGPIRIESLIVQEASNEATILTVVAHGMGAGFVVETARRQCPDGVAILKVADLELSLPLALVWRKDNLSAALQICDRRRESGEAENDDAAGWPVAETGTATV